MRNINIRFFHLFIINKIRQTDSNITEVMGRTTVQNSTNT